MENNTAVNEEMFKFWGVEDKSNKGLLEFLIATKEDLSFFMDKFYTGHILKNMMAFKKYKQEVHNMSREEFVKICNEGKKKLALEKLFQEPVLSDTHMRNVDRSNIPHTKIYDNFKSFPHESITNVINDNCIAVCDVSDDFLVVL